MSGRLLLKRVIDAADRGVKVRLLVDDLNTLLRDAATVQIRDGVVAAIDAHPNLEIRLFNPWGRRDLAGRVEETLTQRDVRVSIVTNSLASHDVPAVNSHYKKWRKPLLEAGVSLYEIRHDAAVKGELADTAPVRSQFMGLHVKAIVVDGERSFIGSMNLDPRSSGINSEMAVIVESKGLAADVAALIRRDMQPVNSWRVELDAQGGLRWTNSDQAVTRQPARNAWQRVEDIIFMAFPRDLY